MKLAEALNERKAMQERLGRLRVRLAANARVQEGDTPAERPEAAPGGRMSYGGFLMAIWGRRALIRGGARA